MYVCGFAVEVGGGASCSLGSESRRCAIEGETGGRLELRRWTEGLWAAREPMSSNSSHASVRTGFLTTVALDVWDFRFDCSELSEDGSNETSKSIKLSNDFWLKLLVFSSGGVTEIAGRPEIPWFDGEDETEVANGSGCVAKAWSTESNELAIK